MFFKEVKSIGDISKTKIDFMKNNKLGFILSSMLAGIFIGIGVLLILSIDGHIPGAMTKFIMGCSFTVALSLTITAGAELFTGSNLLLGIGALNRDIKIGDAGKFWLFCHIFNWLGSILLAVLFACSGLFSGGVLESAVKFGAIKMNIPLGQMLIRSILCNFLVCLAVWCSVRLKSESGKLIMVFWCILAFVVTGFEHSIANMTMLSLSMLAPSVEAISLGGYFYNIIVVSIGNMIGGIVFVALPYFVMSRDKKS